MKHEDKRRAPGKGGKGSGGVSRRDFIQTLGLAGVTASLPLAEGCSSAGSGGGPPAGPLGPGPVEVSLKVNGQTVKASVEPRVTLLDALRDHLKLGSADPIDVTGAKRVCDRGTCGACTLIVDGKTVYSCSMLAVEAQGKEIRTVEGLERNGSLHPVQQEFIACDGMQCGFCTPGFVMAGVACLEKHANPTKDQIRKCLDGNICRCGTQPRALEAVAKAAGRMKDRR